MTAAERKKLVETIHERVSLILCPLGIVVEHEIMKAGGPDVAEFTFKIPDADRSKPGVYQEVIIHLACKDWNRNALESRGWKLGSEGFHNVLCMSGDYPVTGHDGHAAPVFDIDSVGLLSLFSQMNEGLRDGRRPDLELGRTDFFLGCVVVAGVFGAATVSKRILLVQALPAVLAAAAVIARG